MEKRDFWCLPLQTYTDEVFGVTYVRVISQTHYESLKIPVALAKFKFRHLLNPKNLLHVEVIKTRKNWIFKHVLTYREIMTLTSYQDYLKQAELIEILRKHLFHEEPVAILPWLESYFLANPVRTIEPARFENQLMRELGFC